MIEYKIIAAFLILLAGVGGGYFAAQLTKRPAHDQITRLANAMAGGVFLGAAFLHMLPDAIANFDVYLRGLNYPIFALVTACGFFVVMLLDKVLAPMLGHGEAEGTIYPYVLMLTLSVHSVITGMALGLETDAISIGAILFAVLAHKSTAAMSLSISFQRGHAPATRSRKLLWIFYTMTPIGVLIGAWSATAVQGPGEVHFEAIFDALAAGTFFYIAAMDILADEFGGQKSHGSAFVLAAFGFVVMAVVAIWT